MEQTTWWSKLGVQAQTCAEALGREPYQKELEAFLHSYDFMRIGQAVTKEQWPSAMMTLRRMEQVTRRLGLDGMTRQCGQLRAALNERSKERAKNALALLTQKRVQLLRQIERT